MKRILTAALALSLLSGTAALAQQGGPQRNNRGDSFEGRGGNEQNRHDRGRYNEGRGDNEQNRHDRGLNNHDRNDQGVKEWGRNRVRRDGSGARHSSRRWSHGDRLPEENRRNQHVVSDWRQHGLRPPPHGHRWFRDDNNDFFLAAISTGIIATVIYRDQREQRWNRRYSRTYTYNDDVYYNQCRNGPDPAGVIAGALIGGLLGNAVGRGGNRTGATIAGVVVGGVAGAALTQNLNCEDRSYAYRTYHDGFNSGRPGRRYEWHNPRNDHHGEFRVRGYYNDPDGFRCANFTQTVYIGGRQREAHGRGCRQSDGTWAIIG